MENTEKQITRKDIENTPFSKIIDSDTGKTKIALGNYIILDKEFENEELAENYVKGKNEIPWDLILNATSCFTEYILQQKNNKNN